jgi:hypothetical protein
VLHPGDLLGSTGAVVALLLPPIAGESATAEAQSAIDPGDYHFVAWTTNNFWYQVVLRALGNVLGLGDEWELDGVDFLGPPSERKSHILISSNTTRRQRPTKREN